MKHKNLVSYHDELMERLQDPKAAIAYLNASLQDEDPRIFLLALKDVADAHEQDFTAIAKQANLNRENLYRMLSKKGNPKWANILSLLTTLGLQISVQPSKHK